MFILVSRFVFRVVFRICICGCFGALHSILYELFGFRVAYHI